VASTVSRLNPIENVWRIVKREIARKPIAKGVVELQQQVEDAWDSIPLRTIQTLIDSMSRRIAEVIVAKEVTSTGSFLMYWGLVAIFLHASINHCFGVCVYVYIQATKMFSKFF
jgi:hypothetical protein